MNDYGEIISLPYESENIYIPLKKLLNYEKIRNMSLVSYSDEEKTLNILFKKFLYKSKVTVKLTELEDNLTEISVYAETKIPIDFNYARKIVKKIMNIIFKELEKCDKKNSTDFKVSIIQKKNRFKTFINFLVLMIISSIVFYALFMSIDSVASRDGDTNDWVFFIAAIFFGIIYAALYMFIRVIKRKIYKRNRIIKVKRKLYYLIEEKTNKKPVEEKLKYIKDKITIPSNIKLSKEKTTNSIKNLIKNKPITFWSTIFVIGIALSWTIISTLFGSKSLTGEYIQQMGKLSSEYSSAFAHSIKFSHGKAAMAGQGQYYENAPWYEYKIKDNKIYVIKNGKEVYTNFKIKDNNTLIYGDGVIGETCPDSGIKGVNLVCGPDFDGIYKKK